MPRRPLRPPLAPEGWPFVLPAAVAGILLLIPGWPWAAAGLLFLVFAGFCTVFFRDPERRVPSGPGLVVSPADGRVLHAGPASPLHEAPEGLTQTVSIFMGLLDVHVNRAPASGRIESVSHRPGRFLAAWREEASRGNERNDVLMAGGEGRIAFRQVAGLVARRIVFRRSPGESVDRGERVGMIRFGSRVDVFLPPGWSVRVAPGQRVRAGETVLAVAGEG
jgi:phosphatidylserine decarboxylase